MEKEKQAGTNRSGQNKAKKIAITAVALALSYAVSLISFPLFPAAPWLKLDFSYAIMLLAAYLLGPLAAEAIVLLFRRTDLCGNVHKRFAFISFIFRRRRKREILGNGLVYRRV